MYLEDAEKLYRDLEYALICVIGDRKNTEMMFNKSPTEDNKEWLRLDKEKEVIMYAIVDEAKLLVEVTKKQEEMMDSES